MGYKPADRRCAAYNKFGQRVVVKVPDRRIKIQFMPPRHEIVQKKENTTDGDITVVIINIDTRISGGAKGIILVGSCRHRVGNGMDADG